MPTRLSRKSLFWIGPFVLVGLVSIGASSTEAAPKTRTARAASIRAAARTATHKRTLYSAERSLSRKAILARARAVATARETADTPLPRYKVDASGDLVPDL